MREEYRRTARHMGSVFEFTVVAGSEAEGQHLLDACTREVQRIEALLTEFDPDSDTSRINAAADRVPVVVQEEVFQLIRRCLDISRMTDGAFDISAGGLKKLYRFPNGPADFPAIDAIDGVLERTGYRHIGLTAPDKILLTRQGMHINFAAIGKGYAADRVRALLKQEGASGGAINASGDLSVCGARADGSPWNIGIADPDDPEHILLWLPAPEGLCVATSGNYEQYFDHDGVRYGHTIDPRNGLPVAGIKSVTVISPGAELSDALATAITVMGVPEGIDFAGHLPKTCCIIVDENKHLHFSPNLEFYEK